MIVRAYTALYHAYASTYTTISRWKIVGKGEQEEVKIETKNERVVNEGARAYEESHQRWLRWLSLTYAIETLNTMVMLCSVFGFFVCVVSVPLLFS